MNAPFAVTVTAHGFKFTCPYCGRVVEDWGLYAETACVHEFEVIQIAGKRFALFREPARQLLAA